VDICTNGTHRGPLVPTASMEFTMTQCRPPAEPGAGPVVCACRPPAVPGGIPVVCALSGPQQYLVVGRLMEQLSKVRRHLAELGALAEHANRTLVLPRCGASRLGPASDYHLPLCSYFDLHSFPPSDGCPRSFFTGRWCRGWRGHTRGSHSLLSSSCSGKSGPATL